MRLVLKIILLLSSCCAINDLSAQQKDSAAMLEKVTVHDFKNKNAYTSITPTQQLDKTTLEQLNSFSIGDAAKYFSGVLIKDYGGIGGLKTISVRSLGATHTGVLYDGIAMSDMQSGQIDLSRISSTFLQRISLFDGGNFDVLMPARSYSYAALLSANTISYFPQLMKQQWQFGLRQGSFGLWQPFAAFTTSLSKATSINATAEATTAKGNYKYNIDNGSYSQKLKRDNSDIQSLNAEVNVTTVFKDSSTLKNKAAVYASERGLPGAVVFFNERSVQRLWNTTAFAQSVYNTNINNKTAVVFSAKFTHDYTRYLDPDFLNNAGKLDHRYNQDEAYISGVIKHNLNKTLTFSYSSDAAYTTLHSNRQQFASPSRLSLWNVASLQYQSGLFHADANILYTHINEHVQSGNASADKNKFTPAIAFSFKPGELNPFMVRAFYKHIFRMPTFNDLYYNLVGNINLKPEYANQYNAGITYSKYINKHISNFSISADGYYNTVTDKIIAVPNKNLFIWSMLNLGKVHITGVDVNAEVTLKFSNKWKAFIKAAYTYQHAVDVTDKNSSSYKDQLPYTPQHSGSAIVQLEYVSWSFSYSNIFSGSRYALGGNNQTNYLNGFITHDVSLSKALQFHAATLVIKTELSNITNTRYDVVRYFPMQGRSYKISLSINKK